MDAVRKPDRAAVRNEPMKDFIAFISENALGGAPEGAPKPERKIGRIKIWLSLDDRNDGLRPWDDVEYTRRVKSDTVPNAHWYSIGGIPISKMSRRNRRYRAALVYLIDTNGILLGEVEEDTSVSKDTYGRWHTDGLWTETFTRAKRHAETLALRQLQREQQPKPKA
jgi:hypothetical protein